MKITRWENDSMGTPGSMVYLSRQEALVVIRSLTTQLLERSSNSGRAEFHTEDSQEYFSIAVMDNEDGVTTRQD